VTKSRFYTAQEAEAAFYAAFQKCDLEAMMAVWAEDDDILCIHPGGPMLAGRTAIQKSWQGIFQEPTTMTFIVEERQHHHHDSLVIHVVQEHIRIGNDPPQPPLIVTNVYRLTDSGWRMVLHHASPTPRPRVEQTPVLH